MVAFLVALVPGLLALYASLPVVLLRLGVVLRIWPEHPGAMLAALDLLPWLYLMLAILCAAVIPTTVRDKDPRWMKGIAFGTNGLGLLCCVVAFVLLVFVRD